MKKFNFTAVMAICFAVSSASATAQVLPKLSAPILINDHGRIVYPSLNQASNECVRLGARLPTAREIVENFVENQKGKGSLGVDGAAIIDAVWVASCYANSSLDLDCSFKMKNEKDIPRGFAKEDFQLVHVTNHFTDSKVEYFYYSNRNAVTTGDSWIYSASKSYIAFNNRFVFNEGAGEIYNFSETDDNSSHTLPDTTVTTVKCVNL